MQVERGSATSVVRRFTARGEFVGADIDTVAAPSLGMVEILGAVLSVGMTAVPDSTDDAGPDAKDDVVAGSASRLGIKGMDP